MPFSHEVSGSLHMHSSLFIFIRSCDWIRKITCEWKKESQIHYEYCLQLIIQPSSFMAIHGTSVELALTSIKLFPPPC